MVKKFIGRNEGVIDGQEYLSFTEAEVSDRGVLHGIFRMEKCPDTFHPGLLSLSNASSKSSCYAWSKDPGVQNFSSIVENGGKISSARIYSYPDFPGRLLSQVGDAELSADGMYYHTLINGFTEGLPTDPVAIDPYEQRFSRARDGIVALGDRDEDPPKVRRIDPFCHYGSVFVPWHRKDAHRIFRQIFPRI